MGDIEELRESIRRAFPAQRFYGPVTNGCKCDECVELADCLRGRSWDAIDDCTMEVQFGALSLLSRDAFSAFLPAWLMRSLDALDADEQKVREWTLYALALYYDSDEDDADELLDKATRLRWQYERLTSEQVKVVRQVLLQIRDRTCISKWDRESINLALPLLDERLTGEQERP
jgi:hypothetical protein